VAIEFALGVGVLVLPVAALVLVLPGWAERQSMARVAAAEAARTVVVASDWATGIAAGGEVAAEVAANHGLAPGDLEAVRFSGSLVRGDTVTAAVTVRVPLTVVPGLAAAGGFSVTASHSEPVDRYRSLG
jgi:hypothetical protein